MSFHVIWMLEDHIVVCTDLSNNFNSLINFVCNSKKKKNLLMNCFERSNFGGKRSFLGGKNCHFFDTHTIEGGKTKHWIPIKHSFN